MRTWILRIGGVAAAAAAALGAVAAPAGAQQLVDAGAKNGSGAVAFIGFAIMVFFIGFALFFMDRVRRRASDDERR